MTEAQKCSEDEYKKFLQKIEEISMKTKIKLPGDYFRYNFCNCYKCKEEILVFAWPKDFFSNESPKNDYVPITIKKTTSKTIIMDYWGNTCPYCGALQGDFFLYCEPDGAFFGLEFSENPEDDFKHLIEVSKSCGVFNI
jgi:hypothetical protein